MRRGFWLHFFLICAGIVVGSMAAEITSGIPVLGWLSYGLDFGTQSPIVLDLHVLQLTIGATVKITVSHIVFVALSIILGRLIARD